jgi:zinc/manganese transport system permease protein
MSVSLVDRAPGLLFAAGFFGNHAVHVAIAIGAVVAIVAGVVGVFTVMRGQAFAGEAFGDIGTAGGSGAYLIGVGPLIGFVIGNVLGAGAMELIGVQRPRGRDLATGIVLGAAIGLGALFLYLTVIGGSTTGVTQTVLFGSIFVIASSTIPLIVALGLIVLAMIAVLYRPLLLSSVSAEIAAARGIGVRSVGAFYLLALALTVALAAITIGTILSTALLVGPAAAALRLTKSPPRAMLYAAGIGIATVWIGIVLSYDSYYWPPGEHNWPVSFFVVALVFCAYLLSGLPGSIRARRVRRAAVQEGLLPAGAEG